MKLNKHTANLLLVFITLLWGLGFVVTSYAMEQGVGVGLLNIMRGAIFCLLVLAFYAKKLFPMTKRDFLIGGAAGLMNGVAFILQTVSLNYTTPSNSAFLTVTYVLMVPFLSFLMYKKKPTIKLLFCAVVCMCGMGLLTGLFTTKFTVNIGDVFALLCALMYGLSIAFVANTGREVHFSKISFMFGVTQLLCGVVYLLIFEKATVGPVNWKAAILPVLYLGIFSSFVSQSIQVVAQQNTDETTAAMVMTLEGVFGSTFSVIFGYDKLAWTLIVGGLLIALSLIAYEFPFARYIDKIFNKKKNRAIKEKEQEQNAICGSVEEGKENDAGKPDEIEVGTAEEKAEEEEKFFEK